MKSVLPYIILTIILALVPSALGFSNYFTLLAAIILLYTTMVVAWNIIGGYAGQLDLAAGAYHGIGIFATGVLLLWWNITPWIGMIVGGILAVGMAVLIGYPTFRFGLREVWYALSSFALVFILQKFFLIWEEVGGTVEHHLPFYEWSLYHLRFGQNYVYYYVILGLFILTLIVTVRIRYSKLGYYLLAIRENEDAAEMLGVDVRKYKLIALSIYSFLLGLTGGIFVVMIGYYHPSLFDPWISLQTVLIGIVGGLGSVVGPALTAIIVLGISEYLRVTLGGLIPGLHLVIFAVMLMLVVLFKPEGLAPIFEGAIRRIGKAFKLSGGE